MKAEYIRECMNEYYTAILFCEDFENGYFHFTKDEYLKMPATLRDMITIYKNIKNEKKNEQP